MAKIDKSWKLLLQYTRPHWDSDNFDPFLRSEFAQTLKCGKLALGAEIYTSSRERKLVCHTCKCRSCTSCGSRATAVWQAQQGAGLLDTDYSTDRFGEKMRWSGSLPAEE